MQPPKDSALPQPLSQVLLKAPTCLCTLVLLKPGSILVQGARFQWLPLQGLLSEVKTAPEIPTRDSTMKFSSLGCECSDSQQVLETTV